MTKSRPITSDPSSDDKPEVTLDVVSKCECCCFENIAWPEFLERFADPDKLPEKGASVALRIRFKGHRRGKKQVIATDEHLRAILDVLARDRQVVLKKGIYSALGIVVRACGSAH